MNYRRRKKVGSGVSFIFFFLCVMGAALTFMAVIIYQSRQNRGPTENRQPLQTISLLSPEDMLLGRLAAIEERHRSVKTALSDLHERLESASSTTEFALRSKNMPHQPPRPPPTPTPPPPSHFPLRGPQPSPDMKVSHHRQPPMTSLLPATRRANSERNSALEDNRRASYASQAGGQVLPCSLNATIRINRDLASNLGAHWYNHASNKCDLSAISHKMEPGCDGAGNQGKKSAQRQVLVVGVQRSGTHFVWEMFNRLGVHVHHEGLGPDGAVSWFFAYKAATYAINNPTPLVAGQHRFCFVFHLVRHPMRVISSIVKTSRKPWDPYWDWITRVEPRVCGNAKQCRQQPLLLRSARQWLVWNEHIETFADIRYRVEDMSPRDACRLAMFDERICGSDGRFHTTSSKVIQPIVRGNADPNFVFLKKLSHLYVRSLVIVFLVISTLPERLTRGLIYRPTTILRPYISQHPGKK